MTTRLLTVSALAALAVSPLVSAESTRVTAPAGTAVQAAARVDFRVRIPRFLVFRVGTGSNTQTDSTIDEVVFDYTTNPLDVGTGAPPGATNGGDVGNGQVNASVRSNGGQVTITETNDGLGNGLGNGGGEFIPYSQITTTSDNGSFLAPTLSNSSSNTAQPALNGGGSRVTNQQAVWTYAFLNTGLVGEGEYTGRVTYTAATP